MDFGLRHLKIHSETGKIFNGLFSGQTMMNALATIKWFLCTGIFLKASEIIPIERVSILPATLDVIWPFTGFTPFVARGLMGMLLYGSIFVLSLRFITRDRVKISALLFLMLLSLVFFICVGRINTRGLVTGLLFNAYYLYFFWLLYLPLIYGLLSLEALRSRPEGKLIRVAVYFLCGAFIFINILSIHNANLMIAATDKSRRSFLDRTEAFVQIHHLELGFTFFVPHTCPGNYPGKWLHKPNDPLWRRYTLTEVLYPQYFIKVNPKYTLSCGSQ